MQQSDTNTHLPKNKPPIYNSHKAEKNKLDKSTPKLTTIPIKQPTSKYYS